jgi:hypothetical protein
MKKKSMNQQQPFSQCSFPSSLKLPSGKSMRVNYWKIFIATQCEVMNIRKDISLLPETIAKLGKENREQIAKRLTMRLDRIEAHQILTNRWLTNLHSMVGSFMVQVESATKELNEARDRFEKTETAARQSADNLRLKKISAAVAASREESPVVSQLEKLLEAKKCFEALTPKTLSQRALDITESKLLKKLEGTKNGS